MPNWSTAARLRETALVAGPALALVVGAFYIATRFVEPAPPKKIVMTTGAETGAYHAFGKRYAEALAKSGVRVELVTSAGSVENLSRLRADAGSGAVRADVGLMQGGIADPASAQDLMSLGRLFPEPLWVFYRGQPGLTNLADLAGARIAIGAEGSGTARLAKVLLDKSGIKGPDSTFLPLGAGPGADALAAGQIDVLFAALAPEAPLIQKLLRNRDIEVMSFGLADAYTRIFPYLTRVVLPKGVVDIADLVPRNDVVLVAPQAALVARKNLHPAIVGLLVDAAIEIHGQGSLFYRLGDYPRSQDPEFAMSEDAEHFYKSGKPFFRRFLPFWLATFIERLLLMAVPIATVLIPLFKIVPRLYEWRIKSRLLHWYAQLKELELRVNHQDGNEGIGALKAEVDRIERGVNQVPVPFRYSDRYFELRSAVDLVRKRIHEQL